MTEPGRKHGKIGLLPIVWVSLPILGFYVWNWMGFLAGAVLAMVVSAVRRSP